MGPFLRSVIIVCLINIFNVNGSVISPTNSNSTHQYYIDTNETTTSFQSEDIICGTVYCHIICDQHNGCSQLKIDAQISDTLIIECRLYSSCEEFEILKGPKTNLDIYCRAMTSCSNSKIYADDTININLSCKSCDNLLLNATESTSVNIDCLGQYSCNHSKFYLDNVQYATINSNGSRALWLTDIYAYYMTKQLHIGCNGDEACWYTNIYANYTTHNVLLTCDGKQSCEHLKLYASDMEASVLVNCNADFACWNTKIYCPTNNECNITCTTATACADTHFYAPNDQYEGLNLYCKHPASSSCYSADEKCTATLSYHGTNYKGYFKCDSYHCCPIYQDDIICLPGVPCEIDCRQRSCDDLYINAETANSLSLQCTGNSCSRSKILCPTGDNTSCNISVGKSYGFEWSVIEMGTHNRMDSFILECQEVYSCGYTNINLSSALINSLLWECNADNACFSASIINYQSQVIKSFNLSCSDTRSCQQINIESRISDNAYINCLDQDSCIYAHFNLSTSSTTSNTNINIKCKHLATSNSACWESKWYIYGNKLKKDNMNLQCHHYDCKLADFCTYDLYDVDINCNGSNSCMLASVYAESTDNLDVNCNGFGACTSMTVCYSATIDNDCGCKTVAHGISYSDQLCYPSNSTVSIADNAAIYIVAVICGIIGLILLYMAFRGYQKRARKSNVNHKNINKVISVADKDDDDSDDEEEEEEEDDTANIKDKQIGKIELQSIQNFEDDDNV